MVFERHHPGFGVGAEKGSVAVATAVVSPVDIRIPADPRRIFLLVITTLLPIS